MKALFISISIIFASLIGAYAQDATIPQSPISSGYAPSFSAKSTTGDIKFPDDFFGKWKILFSHPADFTPVCTSEILQLALMQDEFKKLNTALIVISTDGINSHLEWTRSIESIAVNRGTPVKIDFPLVSDLDMSISKKYGILQTEGGKTFDRRTVYILNEENKIMAMFYYPNNVGRNIEEIKRTLIALQTAEKNDILTPANWQPGADVFIPSPATISDAEKLAEKKKPELYQEAWYMWYKKL
jgi:peroxiredoxin (alkyl hydroperoxide reductase subunit C)